MKLMIMDMIGEAKWKWSRFTFGEKVFMLSMLPMVTVVGVLGPIASQAH